MFRKAIRWATRGGGKTPPLTLERLRAETKEKNQAFYGEGWDSQRRVDSDDYWYISGYYDIVTEQAVALDMIESNKYRYEKLYVRGIEDAKGDLELLTDE